MVLSPRNASTLAKLPHSVGLLKVGHDADIKDKHNQWKDCSAQTGDEYKYEISYEYVWKGIIKRMRMTLQYDDNDEENPTCPSEDKAAPPARCTPTLFAANDIWPEIFFRNIIRIIFIDFIMTLIDDHWHQHCQNNKLRSLFTLCKWITNLKSAWYCLTWWTDYYKFIKSQLVGTT